MLGLSAQPHPKCLCLPLCAQLRTHSPAAIVRGTEAVCLLSVPCNPFGIKYGAKVQLFWNICKSNSVFCKVNMANVAIFRHKVLIIAHKYILNVGKYTIDGETLGKQDSRVSGSPNDPDSPNVGVLIQAESLVRPVIILER